MVLFHILLHVLLTHGKLSLQMTVKCCTVCIDIFLQHGACTKGFVYWTGLPSEEGSGSTDGQNICHEGLKEGTIDLCLKEGTIDVCLIE